MQIDEEFKNLIPKLSDDEIKQLEENILEEGCREPLVIWNNTIIDGHNRYKICTENNIDFKTVEKKFSNREEAKVWIVKNQLARRNLNNAQKIEIAEKIKEEASKLARKKQLSKLKQNTVNANLTQTENTVCVNSTQTEEGNNEAEKINVNKEIADMVGVSERTVARYNTIQNKAPEEIQKAVKDNVISINQGYEITRQIKDLPVEEQQDKAKKLLDEQFNKECKELDKEHRIYCKITDAVYKPISVEITEENVGYWLKEKTKDEIDFEEKNINEAIENLSKLKQLLKKYKVIRVVK